MRLIKIYLILLSVTLFLGCTDKLKKISKSAINKCEIIYPKELYISQVCILGVSQISNYSNDFILEINKNNKSNLIIGEIINKARRRCDDLMVLTRDWRKFYYTFYSACYRGIKLFINEVVIYYKDMGYLDLDGNTQDALHSLNDGIRKFDKKNPINIKGKGDYLDTLLEF